MKRISVTVILLCFVQLAITALALNPNKCQQKVTKCTCDIGSSNEMGVDKSGGNDNRTVGLAGATGTVAGILLTGSAVAAFLHFRSGGVAPSTLGGNGMEVGNGGGGGGGGGRGGGGGGGGHGNGGRGKRGSHPRPVSSESDGSFGSQSPLTKRDVGGTRPFTGASTASNPANIHRIPKVWPGQMEQF